MGSARRGDDNEGMAGRQDDRWTLLLEPAFTAAHRALVRLDDADIPARLRPVRAASKKSALPKPLRLVLATHLEEEWLRVLAGDELADGSSAAQRASRLFLDRPDGWAEEVEALVEEGAEKAERHAADSLRDEADRLQRLVDDLGSRLREAEARIRELRSDSPSDDRVETLRKRIDRESRLRKEQDRTMAEREAEIERLRHELIETEDRISTLRARSGRTPDPARPPVTDRTFGRGSPLETAKLLDELVETMRPGRPETIEVAPRLPLALPAGVRPDSAEAIDWIMTIERPVLVLVDGHNVAHDLGPDPGRTIRDRIVSETARLRRLGEGPVSAVVFFDTAHTDESYVNFGVSVRFVLDADDAIVATAAGAGVDCIVISTDKDVRRRAAAEEALTLWGTAFSDWIRRR